MTDRICVLSAVLLGLTGCFMIQGKAEMVKREKGGGVFALTGDRDKAMADAKKQMAANCPAGYEIVSEEMTKVGEKTEGAEDTAYEHKGTEKTSESVTSEVKEYRITYECTGAGGGGDAGETSGAEQPG